MLSQGAIELNTLSLLIYSDEHSPFLALKITDSTLFSNPTNQIIARTALDHIAKYNQPPKGAMQYLLEADMKRGDTGKLIVQSLADIEKNYNGVDAGFILQQLDAFLEQKKLITSFQAALELLQQGETEQAKEIAFAATSSSQTQSPGLWMKDPEQALSFLKRDEFTEFYSSGVELLDQRKIRPDRKTLMVTVASTGKGKTWDLINKGKAGLQHHKRVLHITLELDEEKTAARYIQSMFGLTRDEAAQIRITQFLKDSNGVVSLQFADLHRESIIAKQIELRERLGGWCSCPRWHVKQFPTSTLSTEQLSLFLDGLERKEKFRPDLVILDYADLMRIDSKNLRIDTGRLYRELRGLSIIKNFALVTASQGNRESEDAKVVDRTNMAEDWSKAGTADTVITYSQTKEEKALGLARLFVDKARDATDGFMCLISQAYPIGQFCLDAVPMTADLSNQLQAL